MSAHDDDQKLFHAFRKSINAKYMADRNHFIENFEIRHNPPGSEEESWQKCYELAEKYDKGLCDAYREEIDTLLVFAGLFSAVVTAFTIESYQWLHDDSGDVSVHLLAQIATILNSTSPVQIPATSALSEATATRINVYWFVSLVLSLSAALVGILAKQWVREYNRDAGRTHRESLGVRQMKLEGLEAWKVSEIVTSVPLLLQAALALFLLGITELLWQLSTAVAIPVTIIIFLALCFYGITTALPAVHLYWDSLRGTISQCPYKSPQAWLALRATMWFFKTSLNRRLIQPIEHLVNHKDIDQFEQANKSVQRAGSWIMLDLAWTAFRDTRSAIPHPEYRFRALAWLLRALNHTDMHTLIWHCLRHTTTSRFTRHSSANILCCMPENTTLEEILLASPPICQSDQRRLCQFGLLRYALAASMPPETCADLLCQLFLRAERNDSLTAQGYKAFSGLFRELPKSSQGLPVSVSDSLFLVMCCMTERRIDDTVACGMLVQMNHLLSYNQPSQHNTQLALACCARARWWLDAERALGHSGPLLFEASDYAEMCANILRTSAFSIRKTPYEVEDGPPYSLETVVFAYLARDIHSFTRSLWLADPPYVRDIHDIFNKLVDVAASHLSGSMHYQPAGPLVDDSDNLSDLSLLDLDADQSPDVSTVATPRMPRSEVTRAPHASTGREHAGPSTEAAIPPLIPGDTETPRAAPRRGGSLRSASRGRTESASAGHGAPPRGEGDGTMTPAGEHTSPAVAVAGAAASDGTDAAGRPQAHGPHAAGQSLEHGDGDRDSGDSDGEPAPQSAPDTGADKPLATRASETRSSEDTRLAPARRSEGSSPGSATALTSDTGTRSLEGERAEDRDLDLEAGLGRHGQGLGGVD